MKTAVITGVSSGIGKAIGERLEAVGWQVVGLLHEHVDLNNLAAVDSAAKEIIKEHEQIDALIHVAGVWHDRSVPLAHRDLEDFTSQQIEETINVGLTSFMILTAQCLPFMPKDAAIVGITGTFPGGASGWVPYYTSKRALEDFLIGLSQDYSAGPRVYGISPAETDTPAHEKFYPGVVTDAQSPVAIAKLCERLVEGGPQYKSGKIIELRNGRPRAGYHV